MCNVIDIANCIDYWYTNSLLNFELANSWSSKDSEVRLNSSSNSFMNSTNHAMTNACSYIPCLISLASCAKPFFKAILPYGSTEKTIQLQHCYKR